MELIQAKRAKSLSTYASLRSAVRSEIALGKERAIRAVEREKVRTSWKVGKLILDHILLNKERASYGKKVIMKLSRDFPVSHTEFKYMVEFAKTYPIGPPAGQLSWWYYRELLSINDDVKRAAMALRAQKQDWPRDVLRREIKKYKIKNGIRRKGLPFADELTPRRGKLGAYQIVDWRGGKARDLGFSSYKEYRGRKPKKAPKASELYTYKAYVDRVVDGDTIWMKVDLGFGFWTLQKLRLRGVNAPELRSRTGVLAKRFVDKALKGSEYVTITTSKSDKFDRYLVDVFVKDTFLNQSLVDAGLAGIV